MNSKKKTESKKKTASKRQPERKVNRKMKTVIALISAFIALISAMTGGMIMNTKNIYKRTSKSVEAAADSGKTVIDKYVKYQEMNGFGCSGAWWAQEVGNWNNFDEIVGKLYSTEDGIGLNIYRFNVGAGSKDDEAIYNELNRTESFVDKNGDLDFSRDSAAQSCLSAAFIAHGSDLRVTLFANSAPTEITINGKAYCDPKENEDDANETNLAPEAYEAFAEYMYQVAEYFDIVGYRVTDVSPVNEPMYGWNAWYNADGSISAKQEGCYYTPEQTRDLLKAFVAKFDKSALDKKGVKVEMFDSGEAQPGDCTAGLYLNTILSDSDEYKNENKTLRRYFDSASTHSYWSSTDMKLWTSWFLKDNYPTLKVKCTEYCQMSNDHNTGVYDLIQENGMSKGLGIEYGVAMADVIIDDLTLLNATEWDWWLGCSFGDYTDGLIYLNKENHDDIQYSKRYWCLGNFSKFTDEGSVRIAATSGNEKLPCVAFMNSDKSITVVYVNSSDEAISTSIETGNKTAAYYLTDAAHDLECVNLNAESFEVPAQSVLTVVLSGGRGC